MPDGRNALKLPRVNIEVDLNLKISYRFCLKLKKAFIQKTVPETFDCLVSFVPSDISVLHEIQEDKRKENYKLRVSFCDSPIC